MAYEAYCAESDGKSLATGAPLPAWDDLPAKIALAWVAAATAVSFEVSALFLDRMI